MSLELASVIGFSGDASGALIAHPDREHILYPMGCTIVVERIAGKRQQRFLQGHTESISAMTVSPSGRFVASGQATEQGHEADIIVWDFKTGSIVHTLRLHKFGIASLSFSPSESYLLSLGAVDDGMVVVWDVAEGKAMSGGAAASNATGKARVAQFFSVSDLSFVTAGNETLRVWDIDPASRKISSTDIALRSLRRRFTTLQISADDNLAYAGSESGDIVQFSLPNKVLKSTGPPKTKFKNGVTALRLVGPAELVVGSGGGELQLVSTASWAKIKATELDGAVTSVSMRGDDLFVGTEQSQMYRVNISDFKFESRLVCHTSRINNLAFPEQTGDLFATCGSGDIRVWLTASNKQVLHINEKNKECLCVVFQPDGKAILSGWRDGTIRAYTPQSGKMLYQINNAHNKGVTALAFSRDGARIISGGQEGQVRVWTLGRQTQTLAATMKEHKGPITCIRVRADNQECISGSTDGTVIMWDLARYARNQIIFSGSEVAQAAYSTDFSQIVTANADRKVAYWETFDGSAIREVEVCEQGGVHAMDLAVHGEFFAIGCSDYLIKLVSYAEGEVMASGSGHSSSITGLCISPDCRYIVSTGAEGGIFRWLL